MQPRNNQVMPPIFNVSIMQESLLYVLNWLAAILCDYGFRLLEPLCQSGLEKATEVVIESIEQGEVFLLSIVRVEENCVISVYTRDLPKKKTPIAPTVLRSLEELLRAVKRYTAVPHYVVMHSFQTERVLSADFHKSVQAMNMALDNCRWQTVGLDNNSSMFEATQLLNPGDTNSRVRFFAALETFERPLKLTAWVTTFSAAMSVDDCEWAANLLLSEFQRVLSL